MNILDGNGRSGRIDTDAIVKKVLTQVDVTVAGDKMQHISNPTLNAIVLTDRYGPAYSSTKSLSDFDGDIQQNGLKIANQVNDKITPLKEQIRDSQKDKLDKLNCISPGKLLIGNNNGGITYGGIG